MKKVNKKGNKKMNKQRFTLIELLAVIVIMGILMLVLIPMASTYMENSRKDTFKTNAEKYIDSISNLWISDSITCNGADSSGVADDTYYVEIDSKKDSFKKIVSKGGKSPWGGAGKNNVSGYVKIVVSDSATGSQKLDYSIQIKDEGNHGLNAYKAPGEITRDLIVSNASAASAGSKICTLK